MNLEIFNSPDPSGRMSKESYLLKYFPNEHNYIIEFCKNNNITEISFKEKAYLAINNIDSVPVCKNPNCPNKTNFKNSTFGYYEYCSNKCISSDPNVKKIKEQKSIEKFGTKSPAESDLIKSKIIKTNQERYGGNSPMSSKFIQDKSKETLKENYGVDNPANSEEILRRRIESFKKSDYKESFKKSSINKYGVDHPWKNKEIHNKSVISSKIKKNIILENLILKKLENYPEYKLIEILYDRDIKICKMMCNIGHNFEISRHLLYSRHINKSELCTVCNPISKGISGQEISLLNFIIENYNGEILNNSRKIIPPYEIDIYLPDLKLGIEFNGLWWHSVENKPVNYHYDKYKLAKENNIQLISIWEDDWIFKQEIIKSFVLNKINKTPNKIYARNCDVREITPNESSNFLNENHLQGSVNSKIKIGLFYNNILVSLMTFGNLRLSLNQRSQDGLYELIRFCNKNYYNIVGGASKLLKYFIKKYSPNKIITYSDNMISFGKLYETIGFKFISESRPGYWYVIDEKREHRFNWRKSKLVKLGYDPSKTEEEIMSDLGYYRIYNGGNKRWEMLFNS